MADPHFPCRPGTYSENPDSRRPSDHAQASKPLISGKIGMQIPYMTEQGNKSGEQGGKIADQGIKSPEHGMHDIRP
jgi:hypothetical protein